MAKTPNFTATPRAGAGLLSVANPNRTGAGTVVPLVVAGASGSRVERVVVTALGITTLGMIRLFVTNGASSFLIAEIEVFAVNASGTVPAFHAEVQLSDCQLPTGWSLVASTEKAEQFHVVAFGGDY